jgi:hypothetical protein
MIWSVESASARHSSSSRATCDSLVSTRATQSLPSWSRSGGLALVATVIMTAAALVGSPSCA